VLECSVNLITTLESNQKHKMNQNQSFLQPCAFFSRARAFYAPLALAIFGSLSFAIAFAFDNYDSFVKKIKDFS
jgi:hypothetical protein